MHDGNKIYIWPDWTLGWFEHEAVKNWIRLRDRTLISVLERAGNETDEKRNFYEITFDCGSHFQTRSQFHFWSWSGESFMWLKPASSQLEYILLLSQHCEKLFLGQEMYLTWLLVRKRDHNNIQFPIRDWFFAIT